MAATHLDPLAEALARALGLPEGVRLSFDDAPAADPEALARLDESIKKIVLGGA